MQQRLGAIYKEKNVSTEPLSSQNLPTGLGDPSCLAQVRLEAIPAEQLGVQEDLQDEQESGCSSGESSSVPDGGIVKPSFVSTDGHAVEVVDVVT